MSEDRHLSYLPGAYGKAGVEERTAIALGRAVYGERLRRAITQQALAERLGVDVAYVQELEVGDVLTAFSTLRWLAAALGAAGWSCRETGVDVEFAFHGDAQVAAA